ncbi:MAG: sulfurtransferase [Gammaproteobacteria bacterium]|nr:sulfurtransferase [Gammaproteobacteria bacterium]
MTLLRINGYNAGMNKPRLPLILEPDILQSHLDDNDLLVVDLCKQAVYDKYHVPGAIHVDADRITASQPPVMGLLPDAEDWSHLLSDIGITPQSHVVAYDDSMGVAACRFLWTLHTIGHTYYSLLNGGLHSWAGEDHPLSQQASEPRYSEYPLRAMNQGIADRDYILSRLADDTVQIVDTRTALEYLGEDVRALRGGHIPGALNADWSLAVDRERNMRLFPEAHLRALYKHAGLDQNKETILYCHTHRRSAHSFIVLQSLGFNDLRGYPGSWSDWGNHADTPCSDQQNPALL